MMLENKFFGCFGVLSKFIGIQPRMRCLLLLYINSILVEQTYFCNGQPLYVRAVYLKQHL